MWDNICNIPVNEIFEDIGGCPMCRLKNKLDGRFVEYILGAAMMEPDIRIKSNELGYCRDHLTQMMKRQNRLSLALILETRLDKINKDIYKYKARPADKKTAYKTARILETCFICDMIEMNMKRFIDTFFRLYSVEYDFRRLFSSAEYLCLPHFELLIREGQESLSKKLLPDFNAECSRLAHQYLSSLQSDIEKFKSLFDYRTEMEDEETERIKDVIERTALFLNGE